MQTKRELDRIVTFRIHTDTVVAAVDLEIRGQRHPLRSGRGLHRLERRFMVDEQVHVIEPGGDLDSFFETRRTLGVPFDPTAPFKLEIH